MGPLGMTLAVTAAVLPSAALLVRAVARLPRPPLVEIALVAILVSVGVVMAAGMGHLALPTWAVTVSMVSWLAFLLIFPSGATTSRGLGFAAVAVMVVIILSAFWPPISSAGGWAFIVGFAALAGGQVWRYVRRASVAERQATKWLMLGLVPAAAVFLGVGLVSLLPAAPPDLLYQPWYLFAATVGMWLVPLAATAGLLLGERGPVDELVRYGIAAIGTALVAVAIYFVVLDVGQAGWAAVAACVSVLPSAWLFNRVGVAIAYSRGPQRPLAALPTRLGGVSDPREVCEVVADTIMGALGLEAVQVRAGDGLLARVGVGAELPVVEVVEFGGQPAAEFRVAPRRGESGLSRRDRQVLQRIGVLAGPALRGARAATEAAEASERLATAREDERRRLHADLHDELGPALAGIGFTAKAATVALGTDASRATAMLASIQAGTRALVRRVREISYDLRPVELDGQMFADILAERLRVADDPLQILLECEPVADELATDVIRIVQEGVTNVRRHARATTCEVSVRHDQQHRVWVTVSDNGIGAPVGASEGIGHASIRARARAHGGHVSFDSTCRGSRLTAVLPGGGHA